MIRNQELPWIDFQRSSLAFLTKKEASYGRFILDAICTMRKGNGSEATCLGAQVMAGKVYAAEDLILSPPYTFQIAASENRYQIFRNYLSGYDEKDTRGENAGLFSDLRIEIEQRAGRALKDVEEVTKAVQSNQLLNGQVILPFPAEDCAAILDFPVKHINIHAARRMFQVETGPVLVPKDLRPPVNGQDPIFNTAFIFFNRFDRLDLALWSPAPVGTTVSRFYSEKRTVEAEIKLVVPDEARTTVPGT